jgi:hypothetical protein
MLGKDRRDADREGEGSTGLRQPVKLLQQRQVALGGRLVDPLLAVRPAPCAPRVGQVAVEHEGEDAAVAGGLHHGIAFEWRLRRVGAALPNPV